MRGGAFVAAVMGNPASASAADGLMNDRLAHPAPLGAAGSETDTSEVAADA